MQTGRKPAHPWIIPRATSRLYTGRRELGDRFAQALALDRSSPVSHKVFVITGLGGTGKSELCVGCNLHHKSTKNAHALRVLYLGLYLQLTLCLKFAEDHQDKYG